MGLELFARLGYLGPPFRWDEDRRLLFVVNWMQLFSTSISGQLKNGMNRGTELLEAFPS